MLNSSELMYFVMMHSLGLSILLETFKSASYFFQNQQERPRRTKFDDFYKERFEDGESCYAFVQGTGLEVLLASYGLGYDADKLRDGFNYYVRKVS